MERAAEVKNDFLQRQDGNVSFLRRNYCILGHFKYAIQVCICGSVRTSVVGGFSLLSHTGPPLQSHVSLYLTARVRKGTLDCNNERHLDLCFQIKSVALSGSVVRGNISVVLSPSHCGRIDIRPLHYGGGHTTAKSMRVVGDLIKVISPQFTESYFPAGSATCPTVQAVVKKKRKKYSRNRFMSH